MCRVVVCDAHVMRKTSKLRRGVQVDGCDFEFALVSSVNHLDNCDAEVDTQRVAVEECEKSHNDQHETT